METLKTGVDSTHHTSDSAVNLQVGTAEPEVFIFPMSFAQERLWFLEQLRPGISAYNLPIPFRVKGALDDAALEKALQKIVSRHEILRTTFDQIGPDLVQLVAPTFDFKLRKHDLTVISELEREKKVAELVHEEVTLSFDLQSGPLFRGTLFTVSDQDHVFLITMHHIVADGWSFSVILRELRECYESYSHGREPKLKELPVQYGDYAHWQKEFSSTAEFKSRLYAWKNKLADAPQLFDLPIAKPHPLHSSFKGSIETLLLPDSLTRGLQKLGHAQGSTLFMTTMAAFRTLLFRYTNEAEVVLGSPVANRTKVEIEDLVGCFVNTAIFRTQLSGELTFTEVLSRVKEGALETYEYQDIPFEKIVEELQPERALDRNPLVQILFMCHKANIQPIVLPDISFTPFLVDRKGAQLDMTFYLLERDEGLRVGCDYRSDLFDRSDIRRFLEHYETLLYGIVADPDIPICELPLLREEELHQVLVEWNDTAVDYPSDKTIHQLFEEQVRRTPDAVAVVFGTDRMTYSELNRRANQVAHHLRSNGVRPENLVGICLERSVEMVVGILGILKAGGAYVPLDPAYPEERILFMLEDSEAAVLLTTEKLVDGLSHYPGKVVHLDSDAERIALEEDENPSPLTNQDNLAYVIYTSGSTGKPKGVQIEHRAFVNLLSSMMQEPGMSASDVLIAVTTLSFDIAGLELFLPLISGATVIVASREVAADGNALMGLIASTGATMMQATPATWRLLLEAGWRGADSFKILCGGEALPRDLANELVGRCGSLWNMYGPTETTIWSSVCKITSTAGPVFLGKPIANTQFYILDSNLQLLPVGVAGELHIGGDGLARGYFNQPVLTAGKFISNPLAGSAPAKLYKTGDLVRRLEDGNIEFLGRLDNQVKLRGFRIELGEIEAAISGHPSVRESIAIVREDQPGDKRLVAYLVGDDDLGPSVGELRSYLKEKLPEYMVPTAFVRLKMLPLTPNGKVDRRALAPPDISEEQDKVFVAPRSALEKMVADLWAEVLGVERVGVHDDFFELGGHSLIGTQLMSRVRALFEIELPMSTLFDASNVAAMAAILEGRLVGELEEMSGAEASRLR